MTGRLILIGMFFLTAGVCNAQTGESPITRYKANGKSLRLFVFLSPECPLSQNYTKTVNELTTKYNADVQVSGIIPGSAYTNDEIQRFDKKYKIIFPLFTDSVMNLTNFLHASVTPEAVLLDSNDQIIYKGAIDNWVEILGKNKPKPDRLYVQDAITQYLSHGIIAIRKTKAIGCKINDY